MPADRRPGLPRGWLAVLGLSRRRCGSGRSVRFYVGHRDARAEAYIVTREAVAPLTHRAFRGDTPFDWGTRGAGATELSFALLCDATHRRPPDAVVIELAADLLAGLAADGFVLSADELHRWLAQRQRGLGAEPVARAARYERWVHALALGQPWPAYPFLVPMPALRGDDGAGDGENGRRPSAATYAAEHATRACVPGTATRVPGPGAIVDALRNGAASASARLGSRRR
jgi:hypothetical protein